MSTPSQIQKVKFYIGLGLITSATLMLQLIETRILSVIAWYHLAFFVISAAMFGLTAGAVWVYLRGKRFGKETLSHDLAYFSAAFAVSTGFSLAAQMTIVPVLAWSVTSVVAWTELILCVSLPYFFSGIVVSLALTRSPYPIGRVYGVDLLGAALGCLGVLLLLNSIDAPSAVLWVGAVAGLASVAFSDSGIGKAPDKTPPLASVLRRPGTIVAVLIVIAFLNGLTSHGLQPIMSKGGVEKRGSTFLFEKWNSFSRILAKREVVGEPKLWGPSPKLPKTQSVERRAMNIDGMAGTHMYRFNGDVGQVEFLKYDVTNLAYHLPDRNQAAIIGVGGGRDILSARVFGVQAITGIEINPIFVKLLTQDSRFVDFAGLKSLEGVEFITDEARSWFARSKRQFDIIQMSMIDTWAATGAGAFTLSENGLYTVEAWEIFLSRLTSNGVLTVSRWHSPGELDETGRIVSLAVASLLQRGVSEPGNHIFLASTGNIATLVVSKAGLSTDDLRALEEASSYYEYEVLIAPGRETVSEVLGNILSAANVDELVQYGSSLRLDLSPPTDRRPFFFNQVPFYDPIRVIRLLGDAGKGVIRGNLIAGLTLGTILGVSLLLVLATIVIPMRPAIRDVGRTLVAAGTSYFFLIGIGFMAIEIGLLQFTSIFLGHPIYSLSVVLFSLILSTGVGSLLSDRLPINSRFFFMVWSMLIGGYVIGLPIWLLDVFHRFESSGLPVRAAVCVLAIAPAGFLMGFGFPTGMRLVSAIDPRPTPWFWGVNGAAGVLAAGMAVGLSIAFGINMTLFVGGVCYFLLIPCAFAIGFRPSKQT